MGAWFVVCFIAIQSLAKGLLSSRRSLVKALGKRGRRLIGKLIAPSSEASGETLSGGVYVFVASLKI